MPDPPTVRREHAAPPLRRRPRGLDRLDPAWLGLAVVVASLAIYVLSNPSRQNVYNHFVWQAAAFLDGRAAIDHPVTTGPVANDYFQDVYPVADQPGRALVPFPPLPAVLLLPLVALFGLTTNAALVAAFLGAMNTGLAWRLAWRLTRTHAAALLATSFYAFGTVAWYAAMLGSTWFLAHVVASTFLLLAITAALDGDRRTGPTIAGITRTAARRLTGLVDLRQFGVGLLFGTAALARLTVLFGAPFFLFVGSGGGFRKRALSAGLGAAVPVAILLAYNLVSAGSLFHPGYEYLYATETVPRPAGLLADLIPALRELEYRAGEWSIEDPRYLPGNLVIMLAWLPHVDASCGLALLEQDCPLVRPDELGMSLLLTSPAYLLALPLLRFGLRRRIVLGAALAVAAIALVNLMHFSQGWVQFGYRFSNDFAPFALVLVTLAIARLGIRPLTVGLVVASIAINAWGVYWGVTLGW